MINEYKTLSRIRQIQTYSITNSITLRTRQSIKSVAIIQLDSGGVAAQPVALPAPGRSPRRRGTMSPKHIRSCSGPAVVADGGGWRQAGGRRARHPSLLFRWI